jgi:hypothetical protein
MDFFSTRGGVQFTSVIEAMCRTVIEVLPRIANALERSCTNSIILDGAVNSVGEVVMLASGKQQLNVVGHWQETQPGHYHFSPIQALSINGCPIHIGAVEVVRDRSVQRNRHEASELEWGAVNLLCNGSDSQTTTIPPGREVVLYAVPHRR